MDNTPVTERAAGPGAVETHDIQPEPLLAGSGAYEYITILNPLSVDFIGMVGISRSVDTPFQVRKDPYTQTVTSNEQDVLRNYGIPLKNKDHPGRVNIINKVLIPAGKTINLLGNEAQVVVKQLVDEIMQREKNSLMLADKFHRRQVEERVVINRRSVNDLMGGNGPLTVESQLRAAVNNLSKEEVVSEPEFPTIAQPSGDINPVNAAVESVAAGFAGDSISSSDTGRKPIGRPKGSPNKA